MAEELGKFGSPAKMNIIMVLLNLKQGRESWTLVTEICHWCHYCFLFFKTRESTTG